MTWSERHPERPAVSFDGGDLDCGNGLLLLIRRHIDPLDPGGLLEVRSTEPSVEDDLPAWARLTGNELVSAVRTGTVRSYLIRKKADAARQVTRVEPMPAPAADYAIPPFAVMGIGSWPRPGWMLRALQDKL